MSVDSLEPSGVYFGTTGGQVYASADGEMLAMFANGSGSSGQPSFDPVLGRVYASSDRGQLYALRLADDVLQSRLQE